MFWFRILVCFSAVNACTHCMLECLSVLDTDREQSFCEICTTAWSPKPCLHVEMENEDSRSVKRVRISGKTVNDAKNESYTTVHKHRVTFMTLVLHLSL